MCYNVIAIGVINLIRALNSPDNCSASVLRVQFAHNLSLFDFLYCVSSHWWSRSIESLLNETQITRASLWKSRVWAVGSPQTATRTAYQTSVERKDDCVCICMRASQSERVRAVNFEWKCESRARGALNSTAEASVCCRGQGRCRRWSIFISIAAPRALILQPCTWLVADVKNRSDIGAYTHNAPFATRQNRS